MVSLLFGSVMHVVIKWLVFITESQIVSVCQFKCAHIVFKDMMGSTRSKVSGKVVKPVSFKLKFSTIDDEKLNKFRSVKYSNV